MYQLLWGNAGAALPLFHFEICEAQGACPLLRVTIAKKDYEEQAAGTPAQLLKGTEVLFQGVLRAPFTATRDDFVLLVFDGGTAQRTAQLQKMLQSSEDRKTIDLLHPEDVRDHPFHNLNWTEAIPHICRKTGHVTMHDDRASVPTHPVGDTFFQNSLRVDQQPPRYAGGVFRVKVEWMQRYDGVAALGPLISGGRVRTLTPTALQKTWWTTSTTHLRRGYRLLKSALQPHPEGMETIKQGDTVVSVVQFQPTLTLNWHYRQKRVETATWQWGKTAGHSGKILDVPIHVQDVASPVRLGLWQRGHTYKTGQQITHEGCIYRCKTEHKGCDHFNPDFWQKMQKLPTALPTPHAWSFLQTTNGQHLLQRVVDMGRLLEKGASGYIEASLNIGLEEGLPMAPFHKVRLKDARLPHGQITGVIQKLTHVVEGDMNIGFTQIVVRVAQTRLPPYKVSELMVDTPAGGVLYPEQMTAADLVREIHVENDADAQLEHLKVTQNGAQERALKQHPTRVHIRLKPLTHQPTLYHSWTLKTKP